MPESQDTLVLKTGVIPSTGHELARLVRQAVESAVASSNIEAFNVDCVVDGHDIPRASISATGWNIAGAQLRGKSDDSRFDGESSRHASQPPADGVQHLAYGRIGYISIEANPMRIDTATLRLRAEFTDVPIEWSKTSTGEISVGFLDDLNPAQSASPRMRGRFALEVNPQEIVDLFVQQANAEMPDSVEIYRPRIRLTQTSAESFEFTGSCRLRYKAFRVRLGMHAKGTVTSDGVLQVNETSLKGSNLILRMFTSKMRPEIEKPVKLAEVFGQGAVLENFRFKLSDCLSVQGDVS